MPDFNVKRIHFTSLSAMIITTIFMFSCQKDSGTGTGNDEVDPGNADALSSVLILPNGTETIQGNPPQPSNSATAPTISGGISRLTSSNGSTVLIPFAYNTSANVSGCYLYINGAGSYFFYLIRLNHLPVARFPYPLGFQQMFLPVGSVQVFVFWIAGERSAILSKRVSLF